jgi:hypothetical protein
MRKPPTCQLDPLQQTRYDCDLLYTADTPREVSFGWRRIWESYVIGRGTGRCESAMEPDVCAYEEDLSRNVVGSRSTGTREDLFRQDQRHFQTRLPERECYAFRISQLNMSFKS